MIKFDNDFVKSFKEHYGDVTPVSVPTVAWDYIRGLVKAESLDIAFNVVKASYIVNLDYQTHYSESAKRLAWEVSALELDKFIMSVAFYYTLNNNPEYLEEVLQARFIKRDILKEVAVAADITPEQVKDMKTEHTYSIQLPNPKSRDEWFYNMTLTVGSYSKCHSRKIGAVLVRDNSVISTGYNGPPRGIPTCDQRWKIDNAFRAKYGPQADGKETEGICPRRVIGFKSGEGLGICPAGHAERNALINAARLGINTKDTKLYMSCGVPCTPCMVEIINSGVEEIICTAVDWYDETALYLLENSNLKIRLYDFLV